MRRPAFAGVMLVAFALSGCATTYGDDAPGFMSPAVQAAFVPLGTSSGFIIEKVMHGAGVVVAPGIAVTAAHNASMLGNFVIIGQAEQSDLIFFRVENGVPLSIASPQEGEAIVAYGLGSGGELRTTRGIVRNRHVPVVPACPTCQKQDAFLIEADAGPGFSGGPVLDAVSGQLVGITFGYLEPDQVPDKKLFNLQGDAGARAIYAYDMRRVSLEFTHLQSRISGAGK